MKISVIMAARNTEAYIGEALRSIAAQTLQPHEVIVIDDGSTDGTLAAVEASGVDVKLIRVNFANAASARNLGIEHAAGDYIAILDSDDLWYPNHLQDAADALAASGYLVYMGCFDALKNDGTITKPPKPWPIDKINSATKKIFLAWHAATGGVMFHSGLVAQTQLVRDVGGYDPEFIQRHDLDLFLRLIDGRIWTANPAAVGQYRFERNHALSRDTRGHQEFTRKAIAKNS